MTYDELQQSLLILTSRASAANNYAPPTDFVNILPRALEYGQNRIFREMTFLATRAEDSSLTFSGNTRSLTLSAATTIILVPEGLSILTPIGAVPPLGRRVGTTQGSLDLIDVFFPDESQTADPTNKSILFYWAMKDADTIVVGPTPNDTFGAAITGLFQPAGISATNQTTYVSLVYPELLEAACMIYLSGYLRNFGAQSDTPQMAQSWETQYKTLAADARAEEERRRGAGQGWSQNTPTPLAQSTQSQQRT